MSKVQDILDCKDANPQMCAAETTVFNACTRMRESGIGSLIVMDQAGSLLGVFTDRCVSHRVIPQGLDPHRTTVKAVMRHDPRVVTPAMDIDSVNSLMIAEKLRHLPVVNAVGDVINLLSIGDIQAFQSRRSRMTIEYLTEKVAMGSSIMS